MLATSPNEKPQIRAIFQRLKLPESAFCEFCENVLQAKLIYQATNSEILEQTVAAMLRHAWFLVPDGNTIFTPATGSRPGDPVADLLFGFIVSRIMHKVDNALQMEGWGADDSEGPNSIAWVDDMVFHISTSATELTKRVAITTGIVIQICAEHGLSLSMGTNKTAIILDFRGPKATAARQECERTCKYTLPVMTEHHGVMQIPLVSYYKHLGSYVMRGGTLHQEIKTRAAQAFAKLKPLHSKTKNNSIELEKRRLLVKSMAMSVLSLHAGTWFNIGTTEYGVWQSAVHKMYVALQPRDAQGQVVHLTHYEAAKQMNSPMAMELLHIAKLRLLAHLIAEADHPMHMAILCNFQYAQDMSWLASAQRSVTWLKDQIGVEDLDQEFDRLDDLDAWSRLRPQSRRLKKAIAQATEAHMWRVRQHCELMQAEREQRDLLVAMGWQWNGQQDESLDIDQPKHQCKLCDQVSDTPAAVAVHEAKKHQCRIAVRRVTKDAVCRICGRCYHTRVRCLQHLHYGKTPCWYLSLRSFQPMSPEATAMLDEADKEAGTAFHQRGLKSREVDLAWRHATEQEMMDGLALTQVSHQDMPNDQEVEEWSKLGLLPAGQGGRPITKRKMQEPHICNVAEDSQTNERKWIDDLKHWNPAYDYVPYPMSDQTKFLLILFSGHRREGDIASWLHGREGLQAIPIDVAIDPHYGNVLDAKLWVDLIRARRVIGTQAGPPCETSEAKATPMHHISMDDDHA